MMLQFQNDLNLQNNHLCCH